MGHRKHRSPHAERWGKAIRHLRLNRVRLTQKQLAQEIEAVSSNTVTCTRSTVAHWERGDFEPHLNVRVWIARALNTDVDMLFERQAEAVTATTDEAAA